MILVFLFGYALALVCGGMGFLGFYCLVTDPEERSFNLLVGSFVFLFIGFVMASITYMILSVG